MRISHIELATAAAQRLKVLLPAMSGLSGSVQAEVFILYSSLKYLSLELAHAGVGNAAKLQARDVLRDKLGLLMKQPIAAAFVEPSAQEPLSDNLVDVAAIIEQLETDSPADAALDEALAHISQYLHDINQADLDVYR